MSKWIKSMKMLYTDKNVYTYEPVDPPVKFLVGIATRDIKKGEVVEVDADLVEVGRIAMRGNRARR